ncbi:hypothetical protein ES703_82414 [subsurface metagenome]
MSKALLALIGLGVAGVAIYLVWKHYKDEDRRTGYIDELPPEEEPEIPSVPPAEEVEEELPYTPPTPSLEDWNTLASLEYADLHVCPVCVMSFPSMSAMLWHVKSDHPSFAIQNTFPRYNKICVLLRLLTPEGDPAVGIRVKLYQDQALRGQFITDSYGCGDFIKMDAGTFRLDIDQTADYRKKALVLTLRLMTNEVQVVDMAGNKSKITVVTAALNEIHLEKHGWEQIGPTWTGVVTAPPAPAPAPTPPPPSLPEIIPPEPAPDPARPYGTRCAICGWETYKAVQEDMVYAEWLHGKETGHREYERLS